MFTTSPLTLDQIYDRFNGVYQFNFSDMLANPTFTPVYTWPEVIYEQQNTIPQYHYHDCTCTQCQKIHFPCNDTACDYCSSVRALLYNDAHNTISLTPDIGKILPYNEYNLLPDGYTYDTDDMVWKQCTVCDKIYNGMLGEDGGFCSTDCETIGSTIYCTQCGDNEVESYGDYCDICSTIYCASCGENEVDEHGDYCDSCGIEDSLLYDMGQVLDPDEYGNTTEAWIAPNGDLHFVPEWNRYGIGHEETACRLGFNGVHACERAGYIHVSTYYTNYFKYVPSRYSDAQVNTTMLFCDANEWEYPTFVQEWLAEHNTEEENAEIKITPMQNLDPSWMRMSRNERDRFYPLSGD
jgi:hypothetical protein